MSNNRTWPVLPDIVEEMLLEWHKAYPGLTQLDSVTGYTGQKTYAVAITDSSEPATEKVQLLFFQPHGHEPAQTVAAMEAICQLLTGKTLSGERSNLERYEILRRAVLVINPIGNPDGRLRLPTDCWTDEHTIREMLFYCDGKLRCDPENFFDPDDRVGHRVGRFRVADYDFDPDYPIGQRYEQVAEGLYSDPWSDPAEKLEDNPTSLAALVRMMMDRYRFKAVLDLHQYPNEDFVHVWIPTLSDPEAQELSERLADRVKEDWGAAGYHARYPNYYGSRSKFINAVHEYGPTRPAINTIEIGSGVEHLNALMDRETQRGAAFSAIKSALRFYCGLPGPFQAGLPPGHSR